MAQRRKAQRWCQKDKRFAIVAIRDKWLCLYCGRDLSDAAPFEVTLDHLEPRLLDDQGRARVKRCADGRPINDPSNLVTACRACNCSRGTRPWREFAPGGAQQRIERQVVIPLNYPLARAFLTQRAAELAADAETR